MSADDAVGPRPFGPAMLSFAAEVGESDPLTVVGGRTAWTVGGVVDPGAREVAAPRGILDVDAAEQTVRVLAGTLVADLDAALAEVGQEVALSRRPGGTVGGAIAVGHSRLRRRRIGPARDALLEADVVTADGRLVRCGGPTVKNVTGYDLCRLLVGSLGTLAVIGEVLLRTWPRPTASRWLHGPGTSPPEPGAVRLAAAVLWDGTSTWMLLEGHPSDVTTQAERLLAGGWVDTDRAPERPVHRWSVPPEEVATVVAGARAPVLAEVGIGTVHHTEEAPVRTVAPAVRSLNQRMRSLFDPTGRLNPGRDVLLR